jgi:hypothetical protein|tara:strand:- start:12729 stop:14222 length:1494 start_codon:yes stop_codon:yes gene_type:complete
MTSKNDNYEGRVNKLGGGLEQTLGVPQDGMQDPTGEYPKRDYNFGSSINKSARGTKVNELYIGGGDIGLPLDIAPQRPSEYPFNQVQETASGHVIELDDTAGGERVLIKHRKGAGVELRADGSVIISSVNNKIEVTGGDQTTIVEGHGNLVYKGNLNLVVTGDYNVDVGGNYNVQVAGSKQTYVGDNQKTTVQGNDVTYVKKSKSLRVLNRNTNLIYGNNSQFIRGNDKKWIQGASEIACETDMFTSAKNSYAVTSKNASMVGNDFVSVMGNDGTIGGTKVDFTGQTYMGKEGPKPFESGATFYGTFHGQSTEAMFSRFAWKSEHSKYAEDADIARAAGGGANFGSTYVAGTAHDKEGGAPETILNQEFHGPDGPPPVAPLLGAYSSMGDFAIRTVVIDEGDYLLNSMIFTDDYQNYFDKRPTTQEIRSAFRDPAIKDALGGQLVTEERISSNYSRSTPPSIGRTSSSNPTPRFGFTPIGNSIENRGKRFTPKSRRR